MNNDDYDGKYYYCFLQTQVLSSFVNEMHIRAIHKARVSITFVSPGNEHYSKSWFDTKLLLFGSQLTTWFESSQIHA